MNATAKPSISMAEFFARSDVIALQEIQKRNKYGSAPHVEASQKMRALAATFGAESFFGKY